MKAILLSVVTFLAFVGCNVQAGADGKAKTLKKGTETVLIELFTSEGCSSCPPAEALLAKYQKEQPFDGVEAVTLAFHVDYWDYIGWKDKYASPLFTQRQTVYDRKFRTGKIYTPQMVVDGEIEFVGSNRKKAEKAVEKAVKTRKVNVSAELANDVLTVETGKVDTDEAVTVYLAIAEDGLGGDISRGENAGKNLMHTSVVRELRGLGRVSAENNGFSTKISLSFKDDWKRENLKLVVFLQQNSSRNVLGVSSIELE